MSESSRDSITGLIHHPYQPPAGFDAPQVGVFKASTVIFKDTKALRARDWRHRDGYTYGLHGTPTTFTLEERIATLEGGLQCVLVPSGLAAVAIVDFALLRPGDEVLLPNNVYGPSRELARNELKEFGVSFRLYDPMDAAALAAMIGPQTKLVWLEAAGSVTMEFPDLAGLAAAAKARGVLTALDNTWGAGIAFKPFELGIDIVMQALTKFPSGGGDVLMGSVTTRDNALHERIKLTHMRMGWGVADWCCARCRPSPCATTPTTPRRARWRPGWRRGRRSRACCTRRWKARRAMHTGRPPAHRPPACSR